MVYAQFPIVLKTAFIVLLGRLRLVKKLFFHCHLNELRLEDVFPWLYRFFRSRMNECLSVNPQAKKNKFKDMNVFFLVFVLKQFILKFVIQQNSGWKKKPTLSESSKTYYS